MNVPPVDDNGLDGVDAQANAMNAENWWAVGEVALGNGNENLDGQPDDHLERMDIDPWHLADGPGNLVGLPWDDPDVIAQLDREAEENMDAQEHYEPQLTDIDYTISGGGIEDGDPRLEHVPPLSKIFGDQICMISPDGTKLVFDRSTDSMLTLDLPEGFTGQKCRFFDAVGTLCVIVFATDGLNTVMYDFHSGQVLGGGPMPEAIDWSSGDIVRKVVFSESDGFQVIITRGDDIRTIVIDDIVECDVQYA